MIAASARSAKIRQKLQHVRGHRFGARAVRFRMRYESTAVENMTEPDFGCVAALPDWVLTDQSRQILVGVAAAILHEGEAIERELSGSRLAEIAALVGDDLFERLCDLPLPEAIDNAGAGRLPRPEDFATIGARLRRAAMSGSLRDADLSNADSAKARMLCDQAAAVIEAMDSDR